MDSPVSHLLNKRYARGIGSIQRDISVPTTEKRPTAQVVVEAAKAATPPASTIAPQKVEVQAPVKVTTPVKVVAKAPAKKTAVVPKKQKAAFDDIKSGYVGFVGQFDEYVVGRSLINDVAASVKPVAVKVANAALSAVSGSVAAVAKEIDVTQKWRTKDAKTLSRDEAIRMCAHVDKLFSLPAGTLYYMLEREAGLKDGFFDPNTINPDNRSYYGLFQMYKEERNQKGLPFAWSEGRVRANKIGQDPGDLKTNWNNAYSSALAAAGYAAKHVALMRQQFPAVKITPNLLYLGHQQGWGVLRAYLKTGVVKIAGKQSSQTVNEFRRLA